MFICGSLASVSSDVKIIFYLLIGILLGLQYPLWLGDGGVLALWKLKQEIAVQKLENSGLKERNLALEAEVRDLKEGYEALEERARAELGMVRRGETLYQIIERTDGAR
ncbi:MAG: cell division protein FtsB [Proteobacteria bacterium]|nr:cell division protein FtsB [Pseudomonadota bacterium]